MPVAGVRVRAVPLFERESETDSLVDDVITFVRGRRLREEGAREVVTGADGAFRIDGLADRRYWLRAEKKGYAIGSGGAGRTTPDAEMNFTAWPRATLRVRVLGPDGRGVDGARVRYRRAGGGGESDWTADRPEISVEPGRHEVDAVAEDGALVTESVEVNLPGAGDEEDVALRLSSRPGIRGRVVFADGLSPGNIRVKVLRLPEGSAADPERLLAQGRDVWISGHAGLSYRFIDLAPGTWHVGAVVQGRLAASGTIEIADRMVELDLRVPAPAPEDVLHVSVVGPGGGAVPQVRFSSVWEGERGRSSGSLDSVRLADGSYRLRWEPIEERGAGRPGGRFFVEATTPEHGTKRVPVVPRETKRVTIRLEAPARLTARVGGFKDCGYEQTLSFAIRPADEEDTGSSRSQPLRAMDAEGRQEFGPLTPGAYVLELRNRVAEAGMPFPVATKEVTLRAGENAAEIALPPLHTLTVRADRGSVGLRMPGAPSSVFPQRVRDGRVRFPGLPAGEYRLTGYHGLRGRMTVRVPEVTDVEFVGEKRNALRVDIEDEGGILYRSGLRDGDRIIGLGGRLFEDEKDMATALLAARRDGPVELIVARRGGRVTISIDLFRVLGNEEEAGGDFDAVPR